MSFNEADYKSRDIGQLASDIIDALGAAGIDGPALTAIREILDGTTNPSVFKKTFTNGELDTDLELISTLVVNEDAAIKTLAELVKDLKTLIVLAAGEAHVGQIGGTTTRIALDFTRPANTTAYTANDVVSSNAALTLTNALRRNGSSGYITSLTVTTDNSTAMTPRLRVHFASTSTGVGTVLTDNSPVANTYALLADQYYLGYIDLPAMVSTGANTASYTRDITSRLPIMGKAGEGAQIYCLIETLDAFTPSSGQKFTVSVGVEQN